MGLARLILLALVDLNRLAFERELKFTDLDATAALEHHRLGQAMTVDVRPACAAEILEQIISVPPHDRRVLPGDRFRFEHQVTVGIAADDDDVAIDFEKSASKRAGHDLKGRDDALIRFHSGFFPALILRSA